MKRHFIVLLFLIVTGLSTNTTFGNFFKELDKFLDTRSDIDRFIDAVNENNVRKAIEAARSLDPDERINGGTPLMHIIASLPAHMTATEETILTTYLKQGNGDINARFWIKDRGKDLTPLMFAALEGYSFVVDDLLDLKADVNARTSTGHTAVDLAESKYRDESNAARKAEYEKIIEILRKRGGKKNSELPPYS